jgi:hypothetical protein
LSPEVLVGLLEWSGKQYCEHLQTLDPFEMAVFSVAWAGEQESRNWFHIAREYTEKWIHQQQIRAAVNRPGLMTRELFYPFIDTFMYGLPYTYRNVIADTGTTISITVSTEIGGQWYLTRKEDQWNLSRIRAGEPAASISIDPDTAWKLFSKGMSPQAARSFVTIEGNQVLGETALTMVSVMA